MSKPDKPKPAETDNAIAPPPPNDPASVGAKDVDDAAAFWRKHAPKGFEGLIDAKVVPAVKPKS